AGPWPHERQTSRAIAGSTSTTKSPATPKLTALRAARATNFRKAIGVRMSTPSARRHEDVSPAPALNGRLHPNPAGRRVLLFSCRVAGVKCIGEAGGVGARCVAGREALSLAGPTHAGRGGECPGVADRWVCKTTTRSIGQP